MPQVPLSDVIAAAQAGQLISFPTDTVPALAVQPTGAEHIFQVKGRSKTKPLILMAATATDLWPFVQAHLPAFPQWEHMAQTYWPGAVTLVLPASAQVPAGVNPQSPDIGLRVPNAALAQAILAATGPLATTSINRSGQPPLRDWSAIANQFPEVFIPSPEHWPPLLSAPPTTPSPPSTVIQWQAQTWSILRQGAVTVAAHNRSIESKKN